MRSIYPSVGSSSCLNTFKNSLKTKDFSKYKYSIESYSSEQKCIAFSELCMKVEAKKENKWNRIKVRCKRVEKKINKRNTSKFHKFSVKSGGWKCGFTQQIDLILFFSRNFIFFFFFLLKPWHCRHSTEFEITKKRPHSEWKWWKYFSHFFCSSLRFLFGNKV